MKNKAILLADDIVGDAGGAKRFEAVKACASRLATRLGASIDLVHVDIPHVYPVRHPQYRTLIARHVSERRAKLSKVARSLPTPSRALFLSGIPERELALLAARKGAYELIALGTHGRTGLSRILVGSVAEDVIRESPIPVMTVGPKAQKGAARAFSGQKLKLLVPTGLTPNSERAEEYGAGLARRLGAELVLFHAFRESLHPVLTLASPAHLPPAQLSELFETLEEDARKLLEARARRLRRQGLRVTVSLDTRTLSAAEGVLKEVGRTGASLVVMGTHGRNLLAGALFGRTARDVILGSPVPVVTVRSRRK